MAHLVEKMFSARVVPWHFADTQDRTLVTPDRVTMEEAIPASGLDWEVERVPIYVANEAYEEDWNPTFDEVPDMIALQRSTDGAILGIHTDGYQENQPHELFEWGWGIIEASMEGGPEAAAVWETGGSLAGGRRIFGMIRLPDSITIDGDEHVPYLGLADSFDGSMARRAWMTFVRVVCQNTLDWSWSNSVKRISIKHTRNSGNRIAAAREALGISYRNMGAFEREVEQLMNQAVMDDRFFGIVADLFPEPKREETQTQKRNRERRRYTIHKTYFDSPTVAPYRGTAWGVLNAVQEWEQWSARAGSSRMTSQKMAEKQMQRMVTGTWPATRHVGQLLLARV